MRAICTLALSLSLTHTNIHILTLKFSHLRNFSTNTNTDINSYIHIYTRKNNTNEWMWLNAKIRTQLENILNQRYWIQKLTTQNTHTHGWNEEEITSKMQNTIWSKTKRMRENVCVTFDLVLDLIKLGDQTHARKWVCSLELVSTSIFSIQIPPSTGFYFHFSSVS